MAQYLLTSCEALASTPSDAREGRKEGREKQKKSTTLAVAAAGVLWLTDAVIARMNAHYVPSWKRPVHHTQLSMAFRLLRTSCLDTKLGAISVQQ